MAIISRLGERRLKTRVHEAILDAILRGEFADSRLPPEDQLAVLLGVSRTTVRTALQSLEQEGVVSRTPGRGTLVRSNMLPSVLGLHRLVGFSRLLRERGHKVRVVSSSETAAAPDDLAQEFELPRSELYLTIRRLLSADGVPAIATVDLFPAQLLMGLHLPAAELPESPFEFSERFLKRPIREATVELIPRVSDEILGRELALAPGTPCLMLKERHIGDRNEVLGFSRIVINDKVVRLQVVRRP